MSYLKRAARYAAVLWLLAAAPALGHQSEVSPGCLTYSCAARVCKASCQARLRPSIPSADGAWLAATRQCESGGDYSTNTGNGFFGAYQFTLSSWEAVGGTGRPDLASPAEQDARALKLRAL